MLRIYRPRDGHLESADLEVTSHSPVSEASGVVWFDLLNPTRHEDHFVEHVLNLSLPTREEAQELELSARLYHESGAEYMTMTAVSQLESDDTFTSPITFVLKDHALVTIRYAEPKPFWTYGTRVQKPGALPCTTAEQVMIGLCEALIGRMGEALELTGKDLEGLSREVFRRSSNSGPDKRRRDFQGVIQKLGIKGERLGMIRESLVSLNRLLAYHTATASPIEAPTRTAQDWVATLKQDVAALSDHSSYLSNKVNFLLDATLGLINLEQNQIIKIFSIVAVVLLPPTLVGTVYGMNFKQMPELDWAFGYPMALTLIVLGAVIPYLWFRRKGWL